MESILNDHTSFPRNAGDGQDVNVFADRSKGTPVPNMPRFDDSRVVRLLHSTHLLRPQLSLTWFVDLAFSSDCKGARYSVYRDFEGAASSEWSGECLIIRVSYPRVYRDWFT